MLAILLLLTICSDDKLYVVVDTNPDSKCLISDVNRNWTNRARCEPSELSYELADVQCRLSQNLVIINGSNFKECSHNRIPRLSTYPRYRIGEYREFIEFDHKTFSSAGYPTLTMFAIINNHNADENKWKKICSDIDADDARRYLGELLIWGDKNRISDIQNITSHFENEETTIIESIKERHSGSKSFPVYKKTSHPDSPLVRFPYK